MTSFVARVMYGDSNINIASTMQTLVVQEGVDLL